MKRHTNGRSRKMKQKQKEKKLGRRSACGQCLPSVPHTSCVWENRPKLLGGDMSKLVLARLKPEPAVASEGWSTAEGCRDEKKKKKKRGVD